MDENTVIDGVRSGTKCYVLVDETKLCTSFERPEASEVNSTALNRSNSFQGRRKRDGLLEAIRLKRYEWPHDALQVHLGAVLSL